MCLDKLRMHFSNVCYDYKTIKFVQIHVFLAQAKAFQIQKLRFLESVLDRSYAQDTNDIINYN